MDHLCHELAEQVLAISDSGGLAVRWFEGLDSVLMLFRVGSVVVLVVGLFIGVEDSTALYIRLGSHRDSKSFT
jgi:hypothetical protein